MTLPETTDLKAAPSPIAGIGCFAKRPFRKGERVGFYTGEFLTDKQATKRYTDREMTYLFTINKNKYIDGDTHPNPVKYINHSCDGNCESDQKGEIIYLTAKRDIAAGEELAYDYALQVEKDDDDEYPCHCGTKSCRGTMKEQ